MARFGFFGEALPDIDLEELKGRAHRSGRDRWRGPFDAYRSAEAMVGKQRSRRVGHRDDPLRPGR